jgi:hypothetical protein
VFILAKLATLQLMIVVVSKYLTPRGYTGIALFPFVFLKSKKFVADKTMINHERIHLRQQIEMLVIPFFLWYGIEFLFRYFQFKNFQAAYRNISFEREAYQNEKDPDYVKKRSFWSFLAYLG